MLSLKPRTIRGQLIAGLILLEGLLLVTFSALTIREHFTQVKERAERRLEYQVAALSTEAADDLSDNRLDRLAKTLAVMRHSPTIKSAQVTDLRGTTLASDDAEMIGRQGLSAEEMQQLPKLHKTTIFTGAGGRPEAVGPILADERLIGYAWIYPNGALDERDLRSLLLLTGFYVLAAAAGCTLLAALLGRSITRPFRRIIESTSRLVAHPEDTSSFPLALSDTREAAALATGLNLMVASIVEQRAGLNDTLALLDSMLANAPIGFAFFDRRYRLVRINQFLADLTRKSISLQLGRTVAEMLPPGVGGLVQSGIETVFATGEPVRDLELSVDFPAAGTRSAATGSRRQRSWLANLYPVKTGANAVRWVGAIIVDTTDRKASEDALRKTEKLAAAGRLAASIAHEINNPLEAVTNLLYLLRNHTDLDAEAMGYTELAQHEVARVSEITQQTLRFYRQSTLPLMSNIPELIDSVLTLHQGRVNALQVEVDRRYRGRVELFCFAGEMRQLFANFVGNALDAMNHGGGRLTLDVRRSRSWKDPLVEGIRISVADTGTGMDDTVQRRIFEPFFTTKEVTGTGLGLWVSAEIIQKHAGIVRVRSRTTQMKSSQDGTQTKGTGTVFMVFFPDAGAAALAGQAPAVLTAFDLH